MNQDRRPEGTSIQLDTGTRLAYERTFLAQERTQMAWIRTALSLISFGFTISKFFEFLSGQKGVPEPLLGAQTVGMVMIAMGSAALMVATMQHLFELRALRAHCPGLPRSVSGLMGALLALLGVVALAGAIVRT